MFKKITILSFILTFSLSVAAMDKHKHQMSHGKKMGMKHIKKIEISKKEISEITIALVANELMHMAFFKYDIEKIDAAKKKLTVALNNISNKDIQSFLKFAKTQLANIDGKNDKKKNNQNYHMVSSALIYVMNRYEIGNNYEAYYCPMVKKKWIQHSKKMTKTQNPYSADMPTCGRKDT